MEKRLAAQVEFIKSIGAFDEPYYLTQFDENSQPDGDLLQHYCETGFREAKNPSIWFNTSFYLDHHEDVNKVGINPFFHYLKRGYLENRKLGQEWLDLVFYANRYSDIIPENIHPYSHYLSTGLEQGLIATPLIDQESILNELYLTRGFKNLAQLKDFITNQSVGKIKELDCSLYKALYSDLADFNNKKLIQHYHNRGKQEGRLPSFESLIESTEIDRNILPVFDIEQFYKMNPLLSGLKLSEIYLKLVQYSSLDLIRFSNNDNQVAEFYTHLGSHYLVKGHRDKAKKIFLYVNYIKLSIRCNELLGNIFFDESSYIQANEYYSLALELGSQSIWVYINKAKSLHLINGYKKSVDCLLEGLKVFPRHSQLLKLLYDTLQEYWDKDDKVYQTLARLQKRKQLIENVYEMVEYQSEVLKKALMIDSGENLLQTLLALNSHKVHIIGDYHVAQCVRYRIDQKKEQLLEAGYQVSSSSWTSINENEVMLSDIIIVYRAPALPNVVKSITKAKSLGKIVIYEIDDLIFDAVYPANYSEYAGAVSIDEYGGLTHGMALMNAAARLCDYAIASTEPLQQRLSGLVTSGQAFVHRNGLDIHNNNILDNNIVRSLVSLSSELEDETVTIFYGSGTLAHNTDFIEIALPAIERVLSKYSQARFMVVGHLTLPQVFVEKFRSQLIQEPKTKTIDEYWALLGKADINLAVLEVNEINDCKSELKWFEAACFKIPSVVSATKNYLDVISEKKDGMIATTPEEWFAALDLLVSDKNLRTVMGDTAYDRVVEEYTVPILARNIDNIIQSIVAYHGASHD